MITGIDINNNCDYDSRSKKTKGGLTVLVIFACFSDHKIKEFVVIGCLIMPKVIHSKGLPGPVSLLGFGQYEKRGCNFRNLLG